MVSWGPRYLVLTFRDKPWMLWIEISQLPICEYIVGNEQCVWLCYPNPCLWMLVILYFLQVPHIKISLYLHLPKINFPFMRFRKGAVWWLFVFVWLFSMVDKVVGLCLLCNIGAYLLLMLHDHVRVGSTGVIHTVYLFLLQVHKCLYHLLITKYFTDCLCDFFVVSSAFPSRVCAYLSASIVSNEMWSTVEQWLL